MTKEDFVKIVAPVHAPGSSGVVGDETAARIWDAIVAIAWPDKAPAPDA